MGEFLNLGFLSESKINRRVFASVMLLNLGFLSWFFVFSSYISDIFQILVPNILGWGNYVGNTLFFGAIIFVSITTSFISDRKNRRKLLFSSIILGIVSTIFLGFLRGELFASTLSLLLGTSLGLGLPSSMALVADCTSFNNKGKLSGIILLGTFIIAFISMMICQVLNPDIENLGLNNLWEFILLLVILRAISILALVIEKCDNLPTIPRKSSPQEYLYKDFFVYLCTFLLFVIASSLAWKLIPNKFETQVELGYTLRWILIAVFAIPAGYVADRYGRKQPIIIGLASLGIGFLLLAFAMSGLFVIIYSALSGITWGSFFVVFLAIPGDLSLPHSREKFYALGYIFPLIGQFIIAAIPVENITEIMKPNHIALTLGICLFLAIYPLSQAKETLTDSKMKERKLKEHLEIIKKLVQEEEEPHN